MRYSSFSDERKHPLGKPVALDMKLISDDTLPLRDNGNAGRPFPLGILEGRIGLVQ